MRFFNKISQLARNVKTCPAPSLSIRPADTRKESQNQYHDWENEDTITAVHNFGPMLDEIETQPITIQPDLKNSNIGYATHRGVVKKNNQDFLTTVTLNKSYHRDRLPVQLCLIADGMGGYEAGEIASKIAISTAREVVEKGLNRLGNDLRQKLNSSVFVEKLLTQAIFTANKAIMSYAATNQNRMGTTLIAALIVGQIAYIINVGDSRVYHFDGKELNLLTEDHSLVFHLYKTKKISYEDMKRHPKRNLLLNSLGQARMSQQLTHMKNATNHPYFFEKKVVPGETLLFCTDGLWNMVDEKQ
ncbi:serine/threonine-protein phosphatase, partial [bacterium]|nr:serine/threonine-protein phosphatase [bacterium]